MHEAMETFRRREIERINEPVEKLSEAEARKLLEAEHGVVLDTEQLQELYEVQSFLAPYCVVRRKSDNALGSLEFTHSPKLFFNFKLD